MSDPFLRRLVAGLALVGAGVAAYLTYVRATGGVVACTTGGCEIVQSSRYSEVLGIPVAAIGLAGFLAVAASTLVRGELGAALGIALTSVGVAFAAYLVYVQVALIEAICQWCVATDSLMALLFVLSLVRLRGAARAAVPAERSAG